jgi:hypothetical protein
LRALQLAQTLISGAQMGLVFEENDTAAKGLFLKSIDRTKSNPLNAAALQELSIGDNLIRFVSTL